MWPVELSSVYYTVLYANCENAELLRNDRLHIEKFYIPAILDLVESFERRYNPRRAWDGEDETKHYGWWPNLGTAALIFSDSRDPRLIPLMTKLLGCPGDVGIIWDIANRPVIFFENHFGLEYDIPGFEASFNDMMERREVVRERLMPAASQADPNAQWFELEATQGRYEARDFIYGEIDPNYIEDKRLLKGGDQCYLEAGATFSPLMLLYLSETDGADHPEAIADWHSWIGSKPEGARHPISIRMKQLLTTVNIPPHRFYEAGLLMMGQLIEYAIVHFGPGYTDEMIDYAQSTFGVWELRGKDWLDDNEVKVSSSNELTYDALPDTDALCGWRQEAGARFRV